jgi:hypothetical protein
LAQPPTTEDVRALLKTALTPPIAFHASLARISGSVTAGVMLSQAWYWSNNPTTLKRDGWFYKSQKEWWEETGLSRSEQETARKRLIGLAFMEEAHRGVPRTVHYRLNIEAICAALMGHNREMPVEKITELYRANLARLSALAHNRALKVDPEAQRVNYEAVLVRDKGKCHVCSEQIVMGPGRNPEALTFDHRTPTSKGGKHTDENIYCAHMKCNASKWAEMPDGEAQDSLPFDSTSDCGETADKSAGQTASKSDSPTATKSAPVPQSITENTNDYTENSSSAPGSAHEPLPLVDGSDFVLSIEGLRECVRLYPAVDVQQQFRQMRGWLISNSRNRKTRSGITRFIHTWLGREQNKAPRVGTNVQTHLSSPPAAPRKTSAPALPSNLDADGGRQAWESIIAAIKPRIAEHGFNTWLRPVKVLGVSAGVLYVCVGDANVVERKYGDLITNTLKGELRAVGVKRVTFQEVTGD